MRLSHALKKGGVNWDDLTSLFHKYFSQMPEPSYHFPKQHWKNVAAYVIHKTKQKEKGANLCLCDSENKKT